jgi:hypothetical protein
MSKLNSLWFITQTNSELEDVLKNYENEEFEKIQNCAIELRNRNGGTISESLFIVLTKIIKHFGISDVSDFFSIKNYQKDLLLSETQSNINGEVLTEDKFDKDIIPTTKLIGLIGSALIGVLMLLNGSWVEGLLYAVGGVMATLGLCVLLEGISTIIKLLRKISEK